MTEILTVDYMSESTEDLIKRAEQMLAYPGIYHSADNIIPYYRSGFMSQMCTPADGQIRALAGSCHSITIKNVINVTDSSIVSCTATTTITCGAIPTTCTDIGATTPDKYYNFVATINALVAQSGVEITFKYVQNGTPTTQTVPSATLVAGTNTVYAFTSNQAFPSDTELVLYGAEITKY